MPTPVSREELIEDLQRVANELGETPTGRQYSEHGKHSRSTLYSEFGSLGDARKAAGLDTEDQRGGHNELSRQELLDAIHDLHDELGRAPRRNEMLERGPFSEGPYRREFGSWGHAVVEAGYEPHRPNSDLAEYVNVRCDWCGDSEEALESQISQQDNWFCSRDCKHEWQAENIVDEDHHQYNRVTVSCDSCGESFDRKPAVAESRDLHFCDMDCYGDWCSEGRTGKTHPRWNGGDADVVCDVCGETYTVKRAKTGKTRFCSYECRNEARRTEYRGEGNPNYVHGKTGYYGYNWDEQREKRLKEDGYSCVICNTSQEEHYREFNQDLVMHHVIPRRQFVTDGELDADQANKMSNLRTMCVVHHPMWEGIPVAPD